jgi:hypothetical protein
MRKGRFWMVIAVVITFGLIGCLQNLALEGKTPRMSKEEMKSLLGSPDVAFIDVRYGRDWTDSHLKIKGAIREDPDKVESWFNKYPKDKIIILYCA